MTWEELDWAALDRLRAGFLEGAPNSGPYWKSTSDLASYDFTYGERIGWKWDHVLRELKLRGWSPSSRTVLDWGCGSGVAARRVISFFGADKFDSLLVWDHSPVAGEFAAGVATQAFPKLNVAQATPSFLASTEPVGLLIISHVLNELPPAALAALLSLVARAAAVLWVEPGTGRAPRGVPCTLSIGGALHPPKRLSHPRPRQRAGLVPPFRPRSARDFRPFPLGEIRPACRH